MKIHRTIRTCCLLLAIALLNYTASAQVRKNAIPGKPVYRCGTMEVIDAMLQKNPGLREQWRLNGQLAYQNFLQNKPTGAFGESGSQGSSASITVPVVVHIVIDSVNQGRITDRDVEEQIDILNKAFAGINADTSILTPSFASLLGHSTIQFALASKNPNGQFTSGIERVYTSLTVTSDNFNNVKHAGTGGLDAWDVTKYYNIWVCNLTDGLLGIAYMPFMTPANEQGVCIHFNGWGTNPAYTFFSGSNGQRTYAYNLGRSLVHETGHFFYLYHIWGDDNGACTGEDFDTEPGWPLPNACSDDTPNEADATFGIFAGYVRDHCAKTLPGFMYENYMDYSDDISMASFTRNQVCRMENTLITYRTALQHSDGLSTPTGITDADLVDITPGALKDLSYPVILSNTPLLAVLRNRSAAALASIQFNIQLNGGSVSTIAWAGNLDPGQQTVVNLGPIAGFTGAGSAKVYLSGANGATDNNTANDTLIKFFSVANAVNAPLTESFDGNSFPPAYWVQTNMIPSFTTGQWQQNAGTAGTSTHSGTGAARVRNFHNLYTAQLNDLSLPPLDFGSADSSQLRFWVSHGALGADTLVGDYYNDGLEVDVSADSGRSYQPAFRKTSVPDLRTSFYNMGANTPEYIPSGQWREEVVDLTPFLSRSRRLLVRFRNINGFGNDIYLDDVSVSANQVPAIDAASGAILAPSRLCGQADPRARLLFYNNGKLPITSATIHYSVNNGNPNSLTWSGNLNRGDTSSALLPLQLGAQPGNYQITAWVSSPNGSTDTNQANDTAAIAISVVPNDQLTQLHEGFDSPVFPPSGWSVLNPDQDIPWQAVQTLGYSNPGAAAYNDYHNTISGTRNDLSTPNFHYKGVDSVFLTFQLAAATRSNPNTVSDPIDTLSVLLSKDCGNTFTTVYQKWGSALQTLNDSLNGRGFEFFPTALSQWRRDSVNLGQWLGADESQFMVTFRLSSNAENNVFLDDVNLYTRVLPARLKQQGYMVLPTVFQSQFAVWHYHQPINLAFIAIYNATGQLVWERQFNGNADTFIPIDLSGKPAGVYFVRLGYTDASLNKTERVIKQ